MEENQIVKLFQYITMVQIYTFTYGLNFKHKKELEKCFISSDNYLDGIICRAVGICVLESTNPGREKGIHIEVCQRWDNRFCPGMIDTRNISVENTLQNSTY